MGRRAAALTFLLTILPGVAAGDDVVAYHNSITRQGTYTVKGLTLSAAATMRLDAGFQGTISGHVYAQPLFWHPKGGQAVVIVATESDTVYALNADSGAVAWQVSLGSSVPLGELPCGNIDPDGITGTPTIDPDAGVMYLDALSNVNNTPKHLVYALSLANGSTLSGWPVDVGAGLSGLGVNFSSSTQGERSALQFYGGNLYVNFAGNDGDCGTYNGTVVQISPRSGQVAAVWQTKANGGGIWAQGGAAGDGKSVFVTTGNTMGASQWSGGEAIIRLDPGLAWPTSTKDYFAPSNWQQLDDEDLDLGGTEALPFDIGKAQRVIAFGKDGNAYLTDRKNLGGIGGQLATLGVSDTVILTAPAVLEGKNAAMVAFTNYGGGNCGGSSITMLSIGTDKKNPMSVSWCTSFSGYGSPIITTTDGLSNAIVWVTGAEGDNLLHGFNAQTGAVVFNGNSQSMSGLRHFGTLIAAEGKLYVAGDNQVYAFTFTK